MEEGKIKLMKNLKIQTHSYEILKQFLGNHWSRLNITLFYSFCKSRVNRILRKICKKVWVNQGNLHQESNNPILA